MDLVPLSQDPFLPLVGYLLLCGSAKELFRKYLNPDLVAAFDIHRSACFSFLVVVSLVRGEVRLGYLGFLNEEYGRENSSGTGLVVFVSSKMSQRFQSLKVQNQKKHSSNQIISN